MCTFSLVCTPKQYVTWNFGSDCTPSISRPVSIHMQPGCIGSPLLAWLMCRLPEVSTTNAATSMPPGSSVWRLPGGILEPVRLLYDVSITAKMVNIRILKLLRPPTAHPLRAKPCLLSCTPGCNALVICIRVMLLDCTRLHESLRASCHGMAGLRQPVSSAQAHSCGAFTHVACSLQQPWTVSLCCPGRSMGTGQGTVDALGC
jgi:hypothetical protein